MTVMAELPVLALQTIEALASSSLESSQALLCGGVVEAQFRL